MVDHQAGGVVPERGSAWSCAQQIEESAAILLVLEDARLAVAARHDVIHGARILNAATASHAVANYKCRTSSATCVIADACSQRVRSERHELQTTPVAGAAEAATWMDKGHKRHDLTPVAECPDEALGHGRPAAARRTCAGLAGEPHADDRHGHRRERFASLRAVRRAGAAERSVLVPGPRIGDGHGLALLGHHHVGDGRAEARPQSARARARPLHLRRARPPVPPHAAGAASRSPTASGSMATRWCAPAA